MRAVDLFVKQPVESYRKSINPPYKLGDFISLGFTAFVLLAIPITAIGLNGLRNTSSKAAIPNLPDLDVAYIERCVGANDNPCKKYSFDNSVNSSYSTVADPNQNGWPDSGESATFRAKVINHGTQPSTLVTYQWYVDGAPVGTGGLASMPSGGSVTVKYTWIWAPGRHTVKLVVDSANVLNEVSETNNAVEDYSDALAVGLWVEPAVYTWFKDNQFTFCADKSCAGSNSFEDWAQRQMKEWNRMLAESKYKDYPNGALDRVRLDKIVVAASDDALPIGGCFPVGSISYCPDPVLMPDRNDKTVDMMFGFSNELLSGLPTEFNYTLTDGADLDHQMLHEMSHARYLSDLYYLKLKGSNVQVEDANGSPISGTALLPYVDNDEVYYPKGHFGLMSWPTTRYDEHSVAALNRNAGQRSRETNFNGPLGLPNVKGEFFADLPNENKLKIIGPDHQALTGAQISIYTASGGGVIDKTADKIITTNSNGVYSLGTGYYPFAYFKTESMSDSLIRKGVFLIEIKKDGQSYYRFMEVTDYNLACWDGNPKRVFETGNCNRNSATYEIHLDSIGNGADSDNDLFSDYLEFRAGTNYYDSCSTEPNLPEFGLNSYPPDFTGQNSVPDGLVRVADILAELGKYFADQDDPGSNWKRYDLDGNGQVRVADILTVVKSYFKDCPGISGNVLAAETSSVTPNLPPLIRIHDPDVTNDGMVRVDDINAVSKAVGGTDDVYDLDADGKVTTADVTAAQNSYFLNWPLNNVSVGKELKLYLSALDIEADSITYSVELPSGAKLTNPDPGEKNRRLFAWKPTQKGSYSIKFKASSGGQTSVKELKITVK